MDEALHRISLTLLLAVGIATLAGLNQAAGVTLADQHRQVMLALVAAALMLAPWLPALRASAIAAGIASKAALLALAWSQSGFQAVDGSPSELLQLLALVAAGAVLAFEARRQARWDGVLPLRQEG